MMNSSLVRWVMEWEEVLLNEAHGCWLQVWKWSALREIIAGESPFVAGLMNKLNGPSGEVI